MNNQEVNQKYNCFFPISTDSNIDITESVLLFVSIVIAFFLQFPRLKMDMKKLNYYPEYLTEYFYILVRPGIATLFLTLMKFKLNKTLRKVWKNKVLELKEWLGFGEMYCVNN